MNTVGTIVDVVFVFWHPNSFDKFLVSSGYNSILNTQWGDLYSLLCFMVCK